MKNLQGFDLLRAKLEEARIEPQRVEELPPLPPQLEDFVIQASNRLSGNNLAKHEPDAPTVH